MQKETQTDGDETSTREIVKGTRPHPPITNMIAQKVIELLQQLVPTAARVQISTRRFTGELHFAIFRVPN